MYVLAFSIMMSVEPPAAEVQRAEDAWRLAKNDERSQIKAMQALFSRKEATALAMDSW